MGDPVPGKWFGFVVAKQDVTYHTVTIDAQDEESALRALRHYHAEGHTKARAVASVVMSAVVRPMRQEHVTKMRAAGEDVDARATPGSAE